MPVLAAERTQARALSGVSIVPSHSSNGSRYVNILGAVISFLALRLFSLSENSGDANGTPRPLVMPCASHSLYTYSASGVLGVSPECKCRSTKPGKTYMPVASIS